MVPLHFTWPRRCPPWGKLKRVNITIPVHVTRGPAIRGRVIQDIAIQDTAIQDPIILNPAILVLTTLGHNALVGMETL
ncbi:hypothetical protein HHSLTHF2_20570 [Vreelandella venusta]|uniref:Uncharacterized protein n=1 Tax=Halomonas hydrothermalis TaxID=115561 RepID=A0A6F8U3C8_9GAMM|nr:hypothetical protein HHSLTHF2_20570 [Halomonas hydrothermalis]